jgi:hypothetical protein
VQKSSLLKYIFIPFGIALLFAGLFFDGGNAQSPVGLQTTPAPTPDRLAEPTLPAMPSQADLGAQVYWLSCLPCHGDKGQGLTDEFRAVYPPEDQYCWESGCHGANPYESGFTIPKFIPAVVGPTALAKFSNAAQLNSYIRAAMPFWKPGSLTEEDAWKVTAFVLRENRLWSDTVELNATNASGVAIPRGMLIPTSTPQQAEVSKSSAAIGWIALIGSLSILTLLIFILKKSRNTTTI